MWLLGEQLILGQTATVSQVALSGALVFSWNDQYQAYVPSYHIGWTLCYKMTFYAIWCASLVLARRIRVEPTFLAGAFIIALVATAAILSRTTPAAHWMKPYGTPLMLDFLAGVAIRWIEKRDLLNFRTELARRGFAASCAVSALLGFAAVAFGVLPYWLTAAIPSGLWLFF